MNLNPKTGEVELNTRQKQLLYQAKQMVDWLAKVDPKVIGLATAIDRYCGEAK